MDNKSAFDRAWIPPILVGAFSMFGICLVLLLARLSTFRPVQTVETTGTPYQFLFLGTEPGIALVTEEVAPTAVEIFEETATPLTFESPTSEASTEDDILSLGSPTRTRTPATPPTITPTTASTAPLNPGTYDDNDARIGYGGNWTPQSGVNGVFKNTLHVSNTLENSATFRFIGEQVRIFYQSGSGLGTIRINLDGLEYDLDESAGVVTQSEWISPLLINGTHTVTITHLSGGSVNLDMIIIPDVITTATPTP
jgi:hypothetical protein